MNELHRCPNCAYLLVLLERRMKYKCAKCGKLFPQKQIEVKGFQEYNKRQKELDKENLKPKRIKLTEEEKQQKRQEYFEKNKDKIKLKEQEWRDTNREHYNKSKQAYYHKNLEKSRYVMRMKYWRQRQKALTLQMLENQQYGASNNEFLSSLPTYSLSYLL